jgi:hypothetical protein
MEIKEVMLFGSAENNSIFTGMKFGVAVESRSEGYLMCNRDDFAYLPAEGEARN